MNKIGISFFFCIVWVHTIIWAAPSSYYFKSLRVEDGLSQSMIYSILQDKQGFMWFGSVDGLNRYDGHSFRVYKADVSSPNSLPGNIILSLAEDTEENLWIGTDNGLSIYNPKDETFTRFNLGHLDNHPIRSIVKEGNGNMWLAIQDWGLACVTPRREVSFHSLEKYLGNQQGIIKHLCLDGHGSLWVATYTQGLLKFDLSTQSVRQFLLVQKGENAMDNDINHLYMLNAETMLIGTVNHGVMALYMQNEELVPFLPQDASGRNLFVRRICMDGNDNIWIGTETGLYIYTLSNRNLVHLQHKFNDPYSISDNAIHSIFQDRSGGMWIGTFFGGVNYFSESYARFKKYYPGPVGDVLSGKSISEFCEDASGHLWVGTEDGGLNCFDPEKGTFSRNFLAANNVHALCYEASADRLWIGTFAEGLFAMDVRTRRVKSYRNKLNNDNVYAVYQDKRQDIWVGTINGLNQYVPSADHFRQIKEGTITSQVNDILEDSSGVLWFATLGQGVFVWHREDDVWTHYPCVVAQNEVRGRMVICLLEDRMHRIWMGTEGAGLVCYNPREKQFVEYYDVHGGLPNNVVYKIVEDENGCIWGSTNKGLFCLNPKQKDIRTYTHFDGLLGDQFNYKSGLASQNGRLYFGGVKGFVSFHPGQLVPPQEAPHILFTSLQLNNVEVTVGEEDGVLSQSITYTDKIVLPNRKSVCSIGFSELNYAPQPDVEYAYKLEGWDKKWVKAGAVRQVTYSNLLPGTYRFVVQASNAESLWKTCQASIEIEVLPPFYLTVWAFVAYGFVLLFLIFILARTYTLRMQQRAQEAMSLLERKKERELYDAKISFFTNVTHEIRTPLSLIKAPLDEVMKHISERDEWFDNLSIIQRNTNRLLKLVNELLDFRKAESKGLRLNFVRANINEVITDTVKQFVPAAHLREIDFQEELPDTDVYADIDVEVFTKILSNLFNNALKHAKRLVRIRLVEAQGHFFLRVSNDGDCIPKELAEKVFEPFFKLDDNSLGTGIGLPFARMLVETHKGTMGIDTQMDDTTFVITLPYRQENRLTLLEKDEKEELAVEEKEHTSSQEGVQKRVILSVEDNEEFQNFMAKQLKSQYRVLKVKNGKEALDLLARESVDLIISDVMMPVMDGMTLCKQLKEDLRYSDIPIILLTAKTGVQAQLDSLKIGADEYIPKPYSADYLKAKIENLLLNRQKVKEAYRKSPETNVEAIAHSKADEAFLNKLVESIHSRLDEVDLDVDALAAMMNMSRATLYRKVKNISELTPNDFIRLIRLKKAAELLREKEYKINEISYIVGFSSSSYFSKCFYKQFGVLPKDFTRKENAKE